MKRLARTTQLLGAELGLEHGSCDSDPRFAAPGPPSEDEGGLLPREMADVETARGAHHLTARCWDPGELALEEENQPWSVMSADVQGMSGPTTADEVSNTVSLNVGLERKWGLLGTESR